MKSGLYSALHVINQATEQIVEQIKHLRNAGLLTPHFAQVRILAAQQTASETSLSAVLKMAAMETDDANRLEKERIAKEQELSRA